MKLKVGKNSDYMESGLKLDKTLLKLYQKRERGGALIPGEYILQENSFFMEGKKYCIKERKNLKGKKTQFYLIELEPFQFISSLFPTGEGKFTFDYEQKIYQLERNEGSIKVNFV